MEISKKLEQRLDIEQRYILGTNTAISYNLQKKLESLMNEPNQRHFLRHSNDMFMTYCIHGGKFLGALVCVKETVNATLAGVTVSPSTATVIYTDNPQILLDFKKQSENISQSVEGYKAKVQESIRVFQSLRDRHALQKELIVLDEDMKKKIHSIKL